MENLQVQLKNISESEKFEEYEILDEEEIIDDGEIDSAKEGHNTMNFEVDNTSNQTVILTFIFDNKFYVSRKVVVH